MWVQTGGRSEADPHNMWGGWAYSQGQNKPNAAPDIKKSSPPVKNILSFSKLHHNQ
jgi:hypothetical protein